jgi:hypothetical protein
VTPAPAVPLARRVGGGIAGVLVAALTVGAVEWAGMKLFPLPQPIAISDPATAGEAMRQAPVAALAVVVAAWILGAFAGGFAARRIAGPGWPALAVAAFVLVGIAANALAFPHPAWMIAAGVAGVTLAGWLASRLPVGERPFGG